jgi:hypothetical protein
VCVRCSFAVENKISTVTTRWVEACVEAGHCQDEAPYATAAAAATPAPACLGAQRQLQPAHSLMDEATSLLAPAGSSDGSAVPPSAPAGDGTAAPLRRAPSRLQRGASAGDAPAWPGDAGAPAAAATLPPPPHAQQAAVDAAELDAQLGWDDSTPPFLDAVRLLPLGCTPGELRECLQLVRAGAAKRFADWRDDLNHLVVRLAAFVHAGLHLPVGFSMSLRTPGSVYGTPLLLRWRRCARCCIGLPLALVRCVVWSPADPQLAIIFAAPLLPQVGSDLGAAEALRALDFLSTHRSCLPVSLDWLRQVRSCGREGLRRAGVVRGSSEREAGRRGGCGCWLRLGSPIAGRPACQRPIARPSCLAAHVQGALRVWPTVQFIFVLHERIPRLLSPQCRYAPSPAP